MKLNKGDKVKFSAEGKAVLRGNANRRGVLIGWGRDQHPRVVWEGTVSPHNYHPSFITKAKEGPNQ